MARSSRRLPRLDDQSGFTLLETLIAMAIMIVAFSSILMVESGSIRATEKARQLNIVAMLAKNKMVEMEYQFEGRTFEEVKKEDAGQFTAPFEDYRWKSAVKEVEFPNLNAKPSGDDKDQGGGANEAAELISKLITKFLSKALREVTVTIIYKRGATDQNFAVSTYWVNLNSDFELSP